MAHDDPKGEGKETFPVQTEKRRSSERLQGTTRLEGLLDTLNGAGRVAIAGNADAEADEAELATDVRNDDVEPGAQDTGKESAEHSRTPLSPDWLDYQLLKLVSEADEYGIKRTDALHIVRMYSASNGLKLHDGATGQLFNIAMQRVCDTSPQVVRVGEKSTARYVCNGTVALPAGFDDVPIIHIEPEANPSSRADFTVLNSRIVASIENAGAAGMSASRLHGLVYEYLVENNRGTSEDNVRKVLSDARKKMSAQQRDEIVRIGNFYLAAKHAMSYTEQRRPIPKPIIERAQKTEPVKKIAPKVPKRLKRVRKAPVVKHDHADTDLDDIFAVDVLRDDETSLDIVAEQIAEINSEDLSTEDVVEEIDADIAAEVETEEDPTDPDEIDDAFEEDAALIAHQREQERLDRIAASVVKPTSVRAQYLALSLYPDKDDSSMMLLRIGEIETSVPAAEARILAKIMREKANGIKFELLITYMQGYFAAFNGTRLFDTLLSLDANVLMPNGYQVHRDGTRSPILRLREYHPEVVEDDTEVDLPAPKGRLKKSEIIKAVESFTLNGGDYDERLDRAIEKMSGSELIALVDRIRHGRMPYDATRLSIIIETASPEARRELKSIRRALAS